MSSFPDPTLIGDSSANNSLSGSASWMDDQRPVRLNSFGRETEGEEDSEEHHHYPLLQHGLDHGRLERELTLVADSMDSLAQTAEGKELKKDGKKDDSHDHFDLQPIQTAHEKNKKPKHTRTESSDRRKKSPLTATPPQPPGKPKRKRSLRRRIYNFLSYPRSSRAAGWFNIFIMLIVIVSVGTLCFQTIVAYNRTYEQFIMWMTLELVFAIILTTEWLLRFICYPHEPWFGFFRDITNVFDILGVLPLFIELIVRLAIGSATYSSAMQIIRLLRLLRLFKVVKGSRQLRMIGKALARAKDGIYLLGFTYAIGIVLWSSTIYYAEQTSCVYDNTKDLWIYNDDHPDRGQQCAYQSIVDAFWWASVTISTTGYGDVVPKTTMGKIVAVMTMTTAVLLFSLPMTLISGALAEVYQESRQKHALREMKRQRKLTAKKAARNDQDNDDDDDDDDEHHDHEDEDTDAGHDDESFVDDTSSQHSTFDRRLRRTRMRSMSQTDESVYSTTGTLVDDGLGKRRGGSRTIVDRVPSRHDTMFRVGQVSYSGAGSGSPLRGGEAQRRGTQSRKLSSNKGTSSTKPETERTDESSDFTTSGQRQSMLIPGLSSSTVAAEQQEVRLVDDSNVAAPAGRSVTFPSSHPDHETRPSRRGNRTTTQGRRNSSHSPDSSCRSSSSSSRSRSRSRSPSFKPQRTRTVPASSQTHTNPPTTRTQTRHSQDPTRRHRSTKRPTTGPSYNISTTSAAIPSTPLASSNPHWPVFLPNYSNLLFSSLDTRNPEANSLEDVAAA
ncbi:hypothetical protein HK102_001472, partial [Quaeritorhiza haematococci]